MKPRMMFGFVGVLLLMPAVVAAQRGASGGFAASGMRVGSVSSGGAPRVASGVILFPVGSKFSLLSSFLCAITECSRETQNPIVANKNKKPTTKPDLLRMNLF